jgi:hypothetical protein
MFASLVIMGIGLLALGVSSLANHRRITELEWKTGVTTENVKGVAIELGELQLELFMHKDDLIRRAAEAKKGNN